MEAPATAGNAEAGPTARPARSTAAALAAYVLTTLLVVAALGTYSDDLRGSARLVLVSSVVALLSPLFWPGRAATAGATAWRALGWSIAATLLAVVASTEVGGARQVVTAGVMLLAICLTVLGAATHFESLLTRRGTPVAAARGAAAWLATAALVVPAAAPLWLGPAAELASVERPHALHAVVAVSPLTHLAIASGNDLLRNQWLYQHSNLSGLRFDYPRLAPVFAGYAALSVALVFAPAIARSRRKPGFQSTSSQERST